MPHDDPRPGLPELSRAASDVFSARRVFGEPYERDGVLVIPVAKVLGTHGVGAATGEGRLGTRRPGGRPRPGDAPVDAADDAPADGAPATPDPAAGAGPTGPVDAADVPAPRVPEPAAAPDAPEAPGPWPAGRETVGWGRLGAGLETLAGHRPQLPRPYGRGGGDAEGAGFSARVKPLGVYVVDDSGVSWRPALDLNRVILGGQAVGAVAVVAVSFALAFGRRRRR